MLNSHNTARKSGGLATLMSVCLGLLCVQTAQASDITRGQEIYNRHCTMCHGENGKSIMAGATNFYRGQGLFKSDHQLMQRIKQGRKACPAYLGILKEQQIFDVIAYIRTLYK